MRLYAERVEPKILNRILRGKKEKELVKELRDGGTMNNCSDKISGRAIFNLGLILIIMWAFKRPDTVTISESSLRSIIVFSHGMSIGRCRIWYFRGISDTLSVSLIHVFQLCHPFAEWGDNKETNHWPKIDVCMTCGVWLRGLVCMRN